MRDIKNQFIIIFVISVISCYSFKGWDSKPPKVISPLSKSTMSVLNCLWEALKQEVTVINQIIQTSKSLENAQAVLWTVICRTYKCAIYTELPIRGCKYVFRPTHAERNTRIVTIRHIFTVHLGRRTPRGFTPQLFNIPQHSLLKNMILCKNERSQQSTGKVKGIDSAADWPGCQLAR
ncbi:hypothetical protein AVEN_165202-1 [Araneus ventricosus]|uniref:Uncharacterized protein n=1 Tax=Araneus ventricosus TaxID=182803 RepID=A0A4Y2B5W9_ARAVE|nr:hypothetical protein AVEN_165202-1 [Araneus ventricosus]